MARRQTKENIKSFFAIASVRAAIGVFVVAVAAAGAWYLYHYGNPAPCLTYRFTGLYCPGCGSGRAARALLHLDVASALNFNLLFCLFLPFVGYWLLKQGVRYVFSRDVLPFFKISAKAGWVLFAVIVAYTVLRNLPFEPFVFLAP